MKWYIGAFIVVFTLLGIKLPQVSVPNQEIVVKFSDTEVTAFETQQSIAIVKKHLLAIGVSNIQVQKGNKGRLIITYYSDVDVASIKNIFSKEKALHLGLSSILKHEKSNKLPSNDNSETYELAVSEIQKNNISERGVNELALELVPDHNLFFNPYIYLSSVKIDIRNRNIIEKTSYINYRNISITIDTVSFIIPEVRAGPFTFFT